MLRIHFKNQQPVQLSEFIAFEATWGFHAIRFLLVAFPACAVLLALARFGGRKAFTAAGLFVAVLYLYTHWAYYPRSGDNLWYIPTAASLLRDGDLDLREYRGRIQQATPTPIGEDLTGPSVVSYFPLGTSLVATPFVSIGKFIGTSEDRIEIFAAKAFAAGSVALMFLLAARFGMGLRLALLFALAYGFSTTHLSVNAPNLWSHNVSQFLSLLALTMVSSKRQTLILLTAPVLVLAYVTRPDTAILAAGVVVYAALTERKQLAGFLLFLGITAIAFVMWSLLVYGDLVPPYYKASRIRFGGMGPQLLGQLFSPNRGLFIFNPILLFSVAGAILSWTRFKQTPHFFRILSIVAPVAILVVACFPHWWGGWSFGPRLHAGHLGTYFLLLIPLILWLQEQKPGRQWPIATLCALACLWGLFVHGTAVATRGLPLSKGPPDIVDQWNRYPAQIDKHPERVWDWGDMQIFRRYRGAAPRRS